MRKHGGRRMALGELSRHKLVAIYMSTEELAQMDAAAVEMYMSGSAYLRSLVMGESAKVMEHKRHRKEAAQPEPAEAPADSSRNHHRPEMAL